MITLSGLFYFLGLAVAMLYLNMVLLGRRHWAGGEASRGHWLHSVVRFVAVVLALFSFTVIVDQLGVRADASAEQLHTLSSESIDLIKNIPADRPVLIQAYYSPEVPREYVEVKADLLGLLKEYEARSGGKIRLEPGADRAVLRPRRARPRSGSGSSRAGSSPTTRASRCRPRSSWASRSPRASRRSSSRSSTAACRSSTS